MKTPEDIYREHAVRVNDGSGCMIQGGSADSTYILTVKHNFIDGKTNASKELNVILPGQAEAIIVEQHDIFFEENSDVAIIRIPLQENMSILSKSLPEYGLAKEIFGYPISRRHEVVKHKKLDCANCTYHADQEVIELQPQLYQNQGHVNGFSGSGVFEVIHGQVFLVGIEKSMADDNSIDGRLFALPVKSFMRLLDQHKLPPLWPIDMTSFQKLIVASFSGIQSVQDTVRELLRKVANNNIQYLPTPDHLWTTRKLDMIIPSEENFAGNMQFWTDWLEFLVLNKIWKFGKQENTHWLQDLLSDTLFLFKATTDWTKEMKTIAEYRNTLVGNDGRKKAIIIHSFPDSRPTKLSISKAVLTTQITRVAVDKMMIDNALPSSSAPIIHFHKFIFDISNAASLDNADNMSSEEFCEEVKQIVTKTYAN